MQAFTVHRGILAALDRANVDTDQIIPKNFMKKISKTGFGQHMFHDWRYLPDGSEHPEFSLNQAAYKNASILVTRNNFGCGSSREHAVWAICQSGFRVIVAPRKSVGAGTIPAFADIFRNNSVKNGLLTIELNEAEVDKMMNAIESNPGIEATVDLENQTLMLHTHNSVQFSFDFDPSSKKQLLLGLDEIALSLNYEDAIASFEARHDTQLS